jgi:hypothetical protein
MWSMNKTLFRDLMIAATVVLIIVAFFAGAQYSLMGQERSSISTVSITKQVILYYQVIYYTESNCTAGPQTMITSSTEYLLPSQTSYYVNGQVTTTLLFTNETQTVYQSISNCFTYPPPYSSTTSR